MNSNFKLKLEARLEVSGCVVLGGQANASRPHVSTVTFGFDSGADVTMNSPDKASDYPRTEKAMRDCTGALENTSAKTTVELVQKNFLSIAALVFQKRSTVRVASREDCGNTSAESVERTKWISHWSRLRRP